MTTFKSTLVVTSLAFSLFANSPAWACGGHEVPAGETPHPGDKTATFCAPKPTSGAEPVCGFLWFQSHVNTEQAVKFVVKTLTPEDQPVRLTKVELVMDMGGGHRHGSSPVTIDQRMNNVFQITDAYFVMQGEWQVVVEGETAGETFSFTVPVNVGNPSWVISR